jgi:hypothetical protein
MDKDTTIKVPPFEKVLRDNNLEQKQIHDYMQEHRDTLFSWIKDPYERSAVSRTIFVDLKKGRNKKFSILTLKKVVCAINDMTGKKYTIDDII